MSDRRTKWANTEVGNHDSGQLKEWASEKIDNRESGQAGDSAGNAEVDK